MVIRDAGRFAHLPPEVRDRILTAAAGQSGPWDRLTLAKFLAGTRDTRMDAAGLPERPGFGALADLDRHQIETALDTMLEEGWFVVEVAQSRKEGTVRRMRLTDRSRERLLRLQAERLAAALREAAAGGDQALPEQVASTVTEKAVRMCLEHLTVDEIRKSAPVLRKWMRTAKNKNLEALLATLRRAGLPLAMD